MGAIMVGITPRAILLTTLKPGRRFFTTLTMRPGVFKGAYNFGGLTVKWEDTGEEAIVHRSLLVIPATWDNTGKDMEGHKRGNLQLVDAPGADYSVA
jgi:hypothetical protein